MKKILSYLPFAVVLCINMCVLLAFALTGSLGMLALVVPGILALILTLQSITDE